MRSQAIGAREHADRLGLEAQPLIRRAGVGILDLDPERDRLGALVAQAFRDFPDQLPGRALAPCAGSDVEVAELADARVVVQLREREADHLTTVLGDECEVVAQVLVELAELVLEVERQAGGRWNLAYELRVEVAQPLAVVAGCLADVNAAGAARYPVKR